MFQTSTFRALQAPREAAVDAEVFPEDSEYQDVTSCVQVSAGHQARIRKVLRHSIPGALFGGKGCRVSWSVLADCNGHAMHYTVYNCDCTPRQGRAPRATSHGYYLHATRECARHAH